MNTNRGIFDIFAKTPANPQASPFSTAGEPEPVRPEAAQKPSAETTPFEMAGEVPPDTRKFESPFSVAEPPEGFGFEAPTKPAAPAAAEPVPFEFPHLTPPAQPLASPFSQSPETAVRTSQEPAPVTPSFAALVQPAASYGTDFLSDSSSIRQLELRAIFGVDRELTSEEMLQRARGLSGVRHISRVAEPGIAAIEGLKNLLPTIGLQGPLKLHAGNAPVDFIRDGSVLLAVQTDAGYAPGVRETLMIIARELGRVG